MKPSEKSAAKNLLDRIARKDPGFEPAKAVYDLVQDMARDLRALRLRAGLRQDQIAEQIGVTQGRVSQIESGLVDYAPNLETMVKFAHACGARLKFTLQDRVAEAAEGAAEAQAEEEVDVWVTPDWRIVPHLHLETKSRMRQASGRIPARFDFAHMQLRTHVPRGERQAYLRMLREKFGLATDQAVTAKGDEVAIDVRSITLGVRGAKSET